MSDYIKKRAIRYRLKPEEVERYEKMLSTEWEDFLPELLHKYFNLKREYNLGGEKDFTMGYGYDYEKGDQTYVDYMIEYVYGADGDYALTRDLTEEEYKKYAPLFKERFPELNIDELRYVDYCYYNGVDEPAVYDYEPIE